MRNKKTPTDYWFTIEPYVYVSLADRDVLLYNTLDGNFIESSELVIVELIRETLKKENCGVSLLTAERKKQEVVADFIKELRKKFMGDVIDVNLTNGKPVQVLPYYNFSDNIFELYKKNNFSPEKKLLDNLSEITIYIDKNTNLSNLLSFLHSVPKRVIFNVIGNIKEVENGVELLYFLNSLSLPKNVICSYNNLFPLSPEINNGFTYVVLVKFPINASKWNKSRKLLKNQAQPSKYIFEIVSTLEYQEAERLADQFEIENYQFKPVYTGDNIDFFEKNVFLTKKDILSTPMSIKDFFANQSVNIYDFGKINIMSNGDVYANVNDSALGNISTHSIHEIIYKEIEEGQSWLNIRKQAPCENCIYQWFCPPPSDYERLIGRPNLCHVKNDWLIA